MALRVGIQRNFERKADGFLHTFRRLTHAFALSPSFTNSIDPISSPPLILPETDTETDFSCQFPGFSPGGGSLDLMAVPKKRVSRHKRGIRNGPKALKPTPVIVRCKACGRVKLPHFYCCSGRMDPGERSDATN
ncbi:hypothetical protein BVRB_2g042030 [Beta vulgaris subsp. vulgaris]|uniref:uncharacterized protein LOC104887584 n=1 Tax=Beta vulgaris subsp. vulgaris TaxID=3555 RepID=UPI00053F4F2C|nr:uncharacterized protein LOC104887584 [Beta vulgaris subsp. vulgaris]KMT16998.1 hypothetical protein BVRB_2g042030 [Beta vulgaris subsp. vulgaris]